MSLQVVMPEKLEAKWPEYLCSVVCGNGGFEKLGLRLRCRALAQLASFLFGFREFGSEWKICCRALRKRDRKT